MRLKKRVVSLQILCGSCISDSLLMGQLQTISWQSVESAILESTAYAFVLNRVTGPSGLLFIFYMETALAHLKHDLYYK